MWRKMETDRAWGYSSTAKRPGRSTTGGKKKILHKNKHPGPTTTQLKCPVRKRKTNTVTKGYSQLDRKRGAK